MSDRKATIIALLVAIAFFNAAIVNKPWLVAVAAAPVLRRLLALEPLVVARHFSHS